MDRQAIRCAKSSRPPGAGQGRRISISISIVHVAVRTVLLPPLAARDNEALDRSPGVPISGHYNGSRLARNPLRGVVGLESGGAWGPACHRAE